MAFSDADERELLVPLAAGVHERPLWATFLRGLLPRSRATRIVLVVRFAAAEGIDFLVRFASTRPDLAQPDLAAFAAAGLLPFTAQRPERVYALQEMLAYDNAPRRDEQRKLLEEARVSDARFIRVTVRGGHDVWVILLHERIEFGGADSALLSSLSPHLAAAVHTLARLHALELRLAMAEEGLALLGIGQAALDHEGRVVASDPTFASAFDVRIGERPSLSDRGVQALIDACDSFGPASARFAIPREESDRPDLLLRPAPRTGDGLPSAVAGTAVVRLPRREEPVSGARVLARLHGLSDREAALAEAISRGVSIGEAGATLHLSLETARNYSKRIYAKTGATGQADLVRLLLTGLTPLA